MKQNQIWKSKVPLCILCPSNFEAIALELLINNMPLEAFLLFMYSVMKARPRVQLQDKSLISESKQFRSLIVADIYGSVALFSFSFVVFMITPVTDQRGPPNCNVKPAAFLFLFTICHHSICQNWLVFRSFISSRIIHLTARTVSSAS